MMRKLDGISNHFDPLPAMGGQTDGGADTNGRAYINIALCMLA